MGMFNSVSGYLSPITGALGLDPKNPDYSGLAKQYEGRRRNLINTGLNQINAIYSGGTVPVYSQATEYTPGTTYYRNMGGKGWKPFGWLNNVQLTPAQLGQPSGRQPSATGGGNRGLDILGGSVADSTSGGLYSTIGSAPNPPLAGLFGVDLFGGGDKPHVPNLGDALRAVRRGNVYTMQNQTYQGFTPDFYQKRAQAYVDYAMPQLAQQALTTKNALVSGLANRGLLSSTQAQNQARTFNRSMSEAKQGVYDTARSQALDLQNQVEQSRQSAINQLYQTQQPALAAQSALQSTFNLQQPSIFQPLGNAFSNILQQYYTNAILDQYRGPSYTNSPYNMTSPNAGALPGATLGSTGGGY